jgi:hypothetical protein
MQVEPPPHDVYRLHLNPASREHGLAHDFCLERGIVGIGWPVEGFREGMDFGDYLRLAEERGYSSSDLSTIRRFHGIEEGSLVWTRDSRRGDYFLWRVTGPWQYLGGEGAVRADIRNALAATPVEVGWEARVPGKVVSQFIPRMTLQRVRDAAAAWYSAHLFAAEAGDRSPEWRPTAEEVLDSLLSDRDLEDLVAVHLQLRYDYMVLPGSRNRSTPAYEFVLVHRGDGHEAVVQVKRGASEIDLEALIPEPPNRAFACSPSVTEHGSVPGGVEIIGREELLETLAGDPRSLPPVCRTWASLIG